MARHIEFDHCLGLAYGADHAFALGVARFTGGNVGGKLDYLVRLALAVQDGVVGGVDPDFLAFLGQALVFAPVELTGGQPGPELFVGGTAGILRFAEHRMVLALDLAQRITQRVQKILVRVQYSSVQVKLDHGLHAVQRGIYRLEFQFLRFYYLGGGVHKWSL